MVETEQAGRVAGTIWRGQRDDFSPNLSERRWPGGFALHHTKSLGTFGGFCLSEVPSEEPADTQQGAVALYVCDKTPPLASGLYSLHALTRAAGDRRPQLPPRSDLSIEQAIAAAQWLVFDVRCHGHLPAEVRDEFELLAARGNAMLLERKPAP